MASLFISYSRKDINFARKLTKALEGQDLVSWIDWEDIPPTVEWWREIEKGIEEADIFLFLLSSDSAKSKVCNQEIDHAAKNGKRLIPIVVRDTQDSEVPAILAPLNWIFFREEDNFEISLEILITAIKTDYAWVQIHRRLQMRALEWDRGRRDKSLLLRGNDLKDAETQMVSNAGKDPNPTELQSDYVLISRQVSDRQRIIIMGIAIAGMIALAGLAIFGFVQAKLATDRAIISRASELAAQSVAFRERNYSVSLLIAIEAFHLSDTIQTRGALLGAAYARPHLLTSLSANADAYGNLAFSPDGKMLARGNSDGPILLWDVASRQLIGQLLGHCDIVYSVAFSPDGKTLVSGSADGTIILWDVHARKAIGRPLTGHSSTVTFSPDGKMLAFGSSTNMILLWDVQTSRSIGQPIVEDTNGAIGVNSIAFSPDGKILASAPGNISTISIWDIETQQRLVPPLEGHKNPVFSVAFRPDGKMLASTSADSTSILWDVATGRSLGPSLTWYDNAPIFYSVAFSEDGKILALGGENAEIYLWDVETRQPIGYPLLGHESVIDSVAFSPDGRMLASGSADGKIILWDLDPESWITQACQQAGGNFTADDWQRYFPDKKYHQTCWQYPPEPEAISSPTP